jgi:hypothetical protein
VGLRVFAAQAVVDAECPDLKVGKDAVHPGQDAEAIGALGWSPAARSPRLEYASRLTSRSNPLVISRRGT